jgi:serine/threonine protein kinase
LEILDVNSQREVNDFIREGLQMKTFHHPNVMELIGICWLKDERADVQMNAPLIILPFMERGDLKSYLRKSRPGKLSPEEAKVCETINCCYMGLIELSHRHSLIF